GDPVVVAARGADGGDRKDSGVPARRDNVRDRRAGGIFDLVRPAKRGRRVEATGAGVDGRRRRPVRLSRAVFFGAALRAAGRSRAVELSLAAVDRAVLLAAAGRTAGAASYRRRAARAVRNRAAVCRQ